MTASEGDKWRGFIMDVIKIVLPAVLAWQGTAYLKDKEITKKDGALDTCNGVVYSGQSPEYYEGFHEQIALEAQKEADPNE